MDTDSESFGARHEFNLVNEPTDSEIVSNRDGVPIEE